MGRGGGHGLAGPGRGAAGRPLPGRGAQEVLHRVRLHSVRAGGDRAGAPVPAGRDGAGDRRRDGGVRGVLGRAHRRGGAGGQGIRLALARDVEPQPRAGHRRSDRTGHGEPGVGLDPRRRLERDRPVARRPPAPGAEARMTSILDRYVLASWVRLFTITAIGFPIVAVLTDAIQHLTELLNRGLSMKQIAVSYIFAIPEWTS